MGKYPIELDDGSLFYVHKIGINHLATGYQLGGIVSSYKESFTDDDEVNIESGMDDIRYCTIGNIKEAYQILKKFLLQEKPQNFNNYAECVQKTILEYFGDYSNIQNRLSFYPDEDEIITGKTAGKVSNLAHQNAAMCIERAMLSQNLLKMLGFNSYFKASGFINNGKIDAHAYNLVEVDEKYYLFDATIPTLRDNKISPIIGEIPKDVFEKIINPRQDYGISIKASHYNPLQNKDYDVVYDAGRKETYIIEQSKAKR